MGARANTPKLGETVPGRHADRSTANVKASPTPATVDLLLGATGGRIPRLGYNSNGSKVIPNTRPLELAHTEHQSAANAQAIEQQHSVQKEWVLGRSGQISGGNVLHAKAEASKVSFSLQMLTFFSYKCWKTFFYQFLRLFFQCLPLLLIFSNEYFLNYSNALGNRPKNENRVNQKQANQSRSMKS